MGKKGPWWRESDWLLRGPSAANQILLRHSGPILSVRHKYQINISAFHFKAVHCVTTSIYQTQLR